ncbi:glutathione S-transferase [Ramlibacter sp. PS3R-8]|uniref:glutathione S-transferase family protein n=1 Tax=Ramlibacter sp. PS3R-8 TaxID=3133437 RepID=UPI0030968725
MFILHGSPISNYHNKVKLALLEKGIPFEERVIAFRDKTPEMLAASPMGKIPFATTEHGSLCESLVILEYLEAMHPTPALLPADPYAAAKVRELASVVGWHLEMAARQLYPSAFFGAPALSESNSARIRREVEQKIAGFQRLAKFAPFVAGDTFTMADCAAFADLPVVGLATKAIYGEDLLVAAGVDYKPYVKMIGERPAAQKVVADRKAAQVR